MSSGFPGGSVVKNPLASARDTGHVGSIPGLGRSPGGGNDNTLQYSCLENPMVRGTWWAIVSEAEKSQTWLSMCAHGHTHTVTQVIIRRAAFFPKNSGEKAIPCLFWHLKTTYFLWLMIPLPPSSKPETAD